MKISIIFLFLSAMLFTSPIIEEVRANFPNINSKDKAEEFIEKLEGSKSTIGQAYLAAMYLFKSRYVFFPTTKYKYFKKGKQKLDDLIKNNPKNIELRYLRFVFQHQIPKFLNYNKNINEDFLIFKANINSSELDKNFKLKILNEMLLVNNIQPSIKNDITNLLKNYQ